MQGNRLLPDEIYLAVLSLPAGAQADEVTAKSVARQLVTFLRKAGFLLARVRAEAKEQGIEVHIDEGRLARVVFRGQGSLTSLRAKMRLDLPYNVFNAPSLERQLERLKRDLKLARAEYELVPLTGKAGEELQLSNMPGAAPLAEMMSPLAELIRPLVEVDEVGAHELHIFLSRTEWEGDLKLSVALNREDGLVVRSSLGARGPFVEDDRWRLYADAGAAYLGPPTGDEKLTWTIVRGGAQYFTPEVLGLRPLVWLAGEMQHRQRLDLSLLTYQWQSLRAALALQKGFGELSHVTVGGGVTREHLGRLEALQGDPAATRYTDTRAVGLAEVALVFDEEALRIDQRHELVVEGWYLAPAERDQAWRCGWRYQKAWSYGYNDLIIRSSGAAMGGDVIFPYDEPVGERHLRGVFGRVYYVERVASGAIELRLSVTRDVLKLGLFADGAAFARDEPLAEGDLFARLNAHTVFATSFGGGVHALVTQMFQLNIYMAVGYASDGNAGHGVSVQLKKAF